MHRDRRQMPTAKQRQALDLLFAMAPEEAAARLGVRPATVRRWLDDPAFARALRRRCAERREAARRIAAEGVLAAARELARQAGAGEEKTAARAALDVLKASGVLEAAGEDASADGAAIAELMDHLAAEEEG